MLPAEVGRSAACRLGLLLGLSLPRPRSDPPSLPSLAPGLWRRVLSMSRFFNKDLWLLVSVFPWMGKVVALVVGGGRWSPKPEPGALMGVCV